MEITTRDERSLLLFLETQDVDHGGKVLAASMNDDDRAIAKRWNEAGFIGYGRIRSADILASQDGRTAWVELSDEAFEAAHKEQRARSARLRDKRVWHKTGGDR